MNLDTGMNFDTGKSTTEGRNAATEDIDVVSTLEMVRIINAEDTKVAEAVGEQADAIADAIDAISARMQSGGRLIYVGAGTSGRLGVLDASECPPTFNTAPERVVGVIAGGSEALTNSIEGAEDNREAGCQAMIDLEMSALDSVVGIAASGRTPYVLGAMAEARERGALVVAVACNANSPMQEAADIAVIPVVGPEVVTGSTRLKAGTAQKLVLNMLSTGVMIRLGKTYGNLMVDVQSTNSKLRDRACRIVMEATGLDEPEAARLLMASNDEVKTAIVAALLDIEPALARQRLSQAGGVIRDAIKPR
jgi:N-acetylmuramic acid 6-phosphate etherase